MYCRVVLEERYEALVGKKSTTIAKISASATAIFEGIMWGVVVNSTGAPKDAVLSVCGRFIEQVSKMLTPRGSGENQLLLLSLK